MTADVSEFRTDRLLLRRFQADDWIHLRLMDTDPVVMATLGSLRSEEESKAYAVEQVVHWDEHGFGWWMAFELASGDFAGRGGVRRVVLDDTIEIEVGYGLLPHFWGRGLATELAAAATSAGFDALGLERLIGITLHSNAASRRVLEQVGFRHTRESVYKGFDVVVYEQTAAERASGGGVT